MICLWEKPVVGALCLNGCGQKPLKRDYDKPPIRECKAPPTIYLTDTILRDGKESEAYLYRPVCQSMGERTENRVKAKCGGNAAFLPIYKCEVHSRCSPFGHCQDSNLIHPCYACEHYSPKQLDETTQKTVESTD